MITKENLKFCFDNLNQKEIDNFLDSPYDFGLFELHIFNNGAYASIKPMHWDDKVNEEAAANGQIFCCKDTFLRLFKESKSDNEHFMAWI